LEEEASAVLDQDWGNEDSCTYEGGYMRQPVFACKTCSKSTQNFGFCFGCSMTCHIDHDVYELFDKRHFRCDCGTPKSGCNCSFEPEKKEDNTENEYNHNFLGQYCWCNSSYEEDSVMYQCIICLDWYHLECIQSKELKKIPTPEIPCDFICSSCVERHSFIMQYSHLQIQTNEDKTEDTNKNHNTNLNTTANDQKSNCPLKYQPSSAVEAKNTFWIKGWNTSLCKCDDCTELYKTQKVEFLLDENDWEDEAIEEEPKEKKSVSILEATQEAFMKSSIPHEVKIELVHGYNDLRDELKSYMQEFIHSGKEVSKRDIEQFFEDFQTKRRRLN